MGRRLLAAAALLAALAPSAAAQRRETTPRTFGSCASLLGYARGHAADMLSTGWAPGGFAVGGRQGMPMPTTTAAPEAQAGAPASSPAAADDVSQTNVQEAGIDEPDAIKADARRVYVAANGNLYVIDARAATPRILGSVKLADGDGHELLVRGDRVLVLQNSALLPEPRPIARPAQASTMPIMPTAGVARFTEVDVSDAAAPRIVRTERVDGRYVTARLTGRTARIVVTTPARAFDVVPADASISERRREIRRAKLSLWRPRSLVRTVRTKRTRLRPAVACGDVRHPVTFGGVDMLTILTVDLEKGLPAVDTDGLMTEAETVYGSPDRLYVATRRWLSPAQTDAEGAPPPKLRTAIHAFDANKAGETAFRATGEVQGYLLNQFSLSERRGVLRVASTDEPTWWPGPADRPQRNDGESRVTTLDEEGATLRRVGEVAGLGRGERIYAVRFLDDVGYVVTFRQVDPLYVVDLRNPATPKVAGELKIAGYSAYLHPLGPGRLLGVGQDAGEDGRTRGSQVSLFDVSDPAAPRRLAQHTAGADTFSDVEHDHRAFLFWAPTRLALLPLQGSARDGKHFAGALGLKVTNDAISEVGRVSHPVQNGFAPPVTRSVVVGERVLTLSQEGLLASDLATLAPGPYLVLPQR